MKNSTAAKPCSDANSATQAPRCRGGIAVAGPHPQQAGIQEALGSDVLLERDFHLLATDYRDLMDQFPTADMPAALSLTIPKSD